MQLFELLDNRATGTETPVIYYLFNAKRERHVLHNHADEVESYYGSEQLEPAGDDRCHHLVHIRFGFGA